MFKTVVKNQRNLSLFTGNKFIYSIPQRYFSFKKFGEDNQQLNCKIKTTETPLLQSVFRSHQNENKWSHVHLGVFACIIAAKTLVYSKERN